MIKKVLLIILCIIVLILMGIFINHKINLKKEEKIFSTWKNG